MLSGSTAGQPSPSSRSSSVPARVRIAAALVVALGALAGMVVLIARIRSDERDIGHLRFAATSPAHAPFVGVRREPRRPGRALPARPRRCGSGPALAGTARSAIARAVRRDALRESGRQPRELHDGRYADTARHRLLHRGRCAGRSPRDATVSERLRRDLSRVHEQRAVPVRARAAVGFRCSARPARRMLRLNRIFEPPGAGVSPLL